MIGGVVGDVDDLFVYFVFLLVVDGEVVEFGGCG